MDKSNRIERKMNMQKIIKLILIIGIFIVIIGFFSFYIAEDSFRKWVDINILRKEITMEDAVSIDLNTAKNNQIFAYSKYIAVLSNKKLSLYTSNGENVSNIDTDISNAVYDSSEKYFAIAESKGKNFSIVFDKNYMWSGTEEGEISQIHINCNGYVAVVSSDTTYKAIISMYNSSGKLLFKKYFANNRIIDLNISKDNKYIAIGDADISGATIQSNVKIMSIEKAQKKEEEDIINTYSENKDKLLTNITYESNGNIVCMYNNLVTVIKNNEQKNIFEINNQVTFLSTELNNHIVYLEEVKDGILSKDTIVHVIDTESLQEKKHQLNEVAKKLDTNGNTIAINVGTDIYFFNSKGWLVKKYYSSKEITNFVFSDNIAGIVYKDKIEIINL